MIQSFNGSYTHNKISSSKYAIDFNLSIGDTITAARDGIVVLIKENSNEGGSNKKYINKGNTIFIAHNDGTFGYYVHLKFKGSIVSIGDMVTVGQPIGLSGNTGFSSGPHLHFAVLTPLNTSIPIKFKGYIEENKPIKNKYYERID